MKVMALLLAAGQSRRYGADKRLATMPNGDSLVQAMLRRLRKAGIPVRVAVAEGDALAEQLAVPSVFCPNAAAGMGHSIADAVAQLGEQASALMIMPVDLPLIRVSTLANIAAAASPQQIIQPRCQGRTGHPVVFGRQFYADLMALQGDVGARAVLVRHGRALQQLEVDDPGIYRDADTPAQMQALLAQLRPRGR